MRLFRFVAVAVPAILAIPQMAHAQPRPARAKPPTAAPTPAPTPPPEAAAAPAAPMVEIPNELLKVTPGGLTADQVGARAGATSFAAKSSEESVRAAAARVDVAWAAFLPRLTGTARYTRLSDFSPPSLGSGSLVATPAAAGTLNPTPTVAAGLSFPNVLNQWLLQASIVVPISDYFFRINQNYSAATASVEAARYDVVTARARSVTDGKLAYYSWLRARGAVVVAALALEDQQTHLNDAKNLFNVGNASRADVLRAETAVAAAELALERARNLADLTEKQVRVAMHASDDEALHPAEALDGVTPEQAGNLKQLTNEAIANRNEVKSIDANAEVARKQAKVFRASTYPTISAFGDLIEANPNQRRFPATQDWFPTWDLGAQLVWSPNDILTSSGNVHDFEARAVAIETQRGVVRDGIEIEVTQAWQLLKESKVALESTKRQLASATEAYRVAHELFVNGRGTSTTLTDAETELTRARLDALNANADARIARVRLDHALGRDVLRDNK